VERKLTRIVVTIMLMGAMVLTCITGGIIWRLVTYKDAAALRSAPTLSQAGKCASLYNVGSHEAWADCMGVGYK